MRNDICDGCAWSPSWGLTGVSKPGTAPCVPLSLTKKPIQAAPPRDEPLETTVSSTMGMHRRRIPATIGGRDSPKVHEDKFGAIHPAPPARNQGGRDPGRLA